MGCDKAEEAAWGEIQKSRTKPPLIQVVCMIANEKTVNFSIIYKKKEVATMNSANSE